MPEGLPESEGLAVLGDPVLHSQSPELFRAAFAARGRQASYTRVVCRDGRRAVELIAGLGLAGANVTSPLKESLARELDALVGVAGRLGAVNCLVREGERLIGHNTDVDGVRGVLQEAGLARAGLSAVVLGAGGAGLAAALALVELGAEVRLLSRSAARSRAGAGRVGCLSGTLEGGEAFLTQAELVVGCLPARAEVVPLDGLRPGQTVLDAVYPEGPLGRAARLRGCRVLAGERWLLHQAVAAHALFFPGPAPSDAMQAALPPPGGRACAQRPLALVGFMGAGKSTLGRLLADRLGRPFVDLDERIAARAGCSIPDLFRAEGEPGFRARERQELQAVLEGAPRVVVACGGGAPLDPGNRDRLRSACLVLWLWVGLETALGRCEGSARPLLRGGSPEEVRGLWQVRQRAYAEASDLVVDAEQAPERVAEEIQRAVGATG